MRVFLDALRAGLRDVFLAALRAALRAGLLEAAFALGLRAGFLDLRAGLRVFLAALRAGLFALRAGLFDPAFLDLPDSIADTSDVIFLAVFWRVFISDSISSTCPRSERSRDWAVSFSSSEFANSTSCSVRSASSLVDARRSLAEATSLSMLSSWCLFRVRSICTAGSGAGRLLAAITAGGRSLIC